VPECLDSRCMKVARSSVLHSGRPYPQETSLVLISVRVEVDLQGLCTVGRITSMKNPNNVIGNQTPDPQYDKSIIRLLHREVKIILRAVSPTFHAAKTRARSQDSSYGKCG